MKAFDAKTGKEPWKFQTGSGVVSVPITWEMDCEQYIGLFLRLRRCSLPVGATWADLTKQVTRASFWAFRCPRSLAGSAILAGSPGRPGAFQFKRTLPCPHPNSAGTLRPFCCCWAGQAQAAGLT